jgi:phosphoglycerate dehydrogenase-like enzyme
LIGRALLAQCRLGVHVVNVARGAVLETDALLHALDEGRVGHATLDVTDPEPLPLGHRLYSHASVTLTPHIAFSGPSTERRGNQLFSQNLQRFLSGEALHQVTR